MTSIKDGFKFGVDSGGTLFATITVDAGEAPFDGRYSQTVTLIKVGPEWQLTTKLRTPVIKGEPTLPELCQAAYVNHLMLGDATRNEALEIELEVERRLGLKPTALDGGSGV